MTVFKCKMCNAPMEVTNGMTVCECEYCGTKQTLPKLDDKSKLELCGRANYYRSDNEYDKAMAIYEQILAKDDTDAEVYWSLVLCKYGIEYVEDASTHKRVPTLNRTQFTSIFDDKNYKLALKYADNVQRQLYENEADLINDIQKKFLTISKEEEPFDVFICYKEDDGNRERTKDSFLATDLYQILTNEGFKVFLSRITLEEKPGIAYEPYIFAALNSAKVMVVLGTKPEYFNATWVKNEWSRFLSLIKRGQKKALIPAYKDMDPYDLPDEFSCLQAKDMSKLSFMQDLIKIITKLVPYKDEKKSIARDFVHINPLLKRMNLFLEDGEWNRANKYAERVLDLDPECAEAYLGKLMVELYVNKKEMLRDEECPFDQNNNFKKIMRFGNEMEKQELTECIDYIRNRNEENRLNSIYNAAKNKMDENSELSYKEAAKLLETIQEYKDSETLLNECYEKVETIRKDSILESGNSIVARILNNSLKNNLKYITDINLFSKKCKIYKDRKLHYKKAIEIFETIPGWKDADEQASLCKSKIEEIKKNEMYCIGLVCAFILMLGFINIHILIVLAFFVLLLLGTILEYWKNNKDKIKTLEKGDDIKFGNYEQKEIKWTILDIKNGRRLLISKYALDVKQYHELEGNITWENCTLRKWLNGEFYENAFSEHEKELVLTVTVKSDINPKYGVRNGADTNDKVFLLSINEADRYFDSIKSRQCYPSSNIKGHGAYESKQYEGTTWWWLRSAGCDQECAAYVCSDGGISDRGGCANIGNIAVRPALWLDSEL